MQVCREQIDFSSSIASPHSIFMIHHLERTIIMLASDMIQSYKTLAWESYGNFIIKLSA